MVRASSRRRLVVETLGAPRSSAGISGPDDRCHDGPGAGGDHDRLHPRPQVQ